MAFTFFFRDSQALELAIDEALPSLRGRAFIHVWDAGCAHGPEPYTLAILYRKVEPAFVEHQVQEGVPDRHDRRRMDVRGERPLSQLARE